MASKVLKQTRPCNASCCRAAPAFPEKVGDRMCRYLNSENRCMVMLGEVKLTEKKDLDKFKNSCDEWPQNTKAIDNDIGNCCWEWVDDGD